MFVDDSAALAAQAQSPSPIEDFSDVPADKRPAVLYARRCLADGRAYNEGVLNSIWLQLGNYNRPARRLSQARRSKLLKAATACARCGEPFDKSRKKTIEHTRGDDNSPDALTVVCWDCNQLTAGNWKPDNPLPDRRDELLELVARTLPPNPRVFETPLPEGKYAFQADAIERVWTQLCSGKKTILQAVTGAGKTRMAIYLAIRALEARPGRPVLVVVHRSNMFRNWCKQFIAAGFDERDISYGECPTNLLAPVQMATIQSMHRRPDIAALPSICIVDECHHAAARSYHELFDQFGLLENHAGAPFLLGLSATPVRHDRKSLATYFDVMEKAESADRLRELKVIRRVIYQAPTDKHFEQALREISKKSHGEDFSAKDIDALLTAERFAIMVGDAADHWARFGCLLAIVFVARIKDCVPTVAAFNARGARADFITGEMTPELREAKLSAFERGEINVLVNALLLTEAVDVPEACYIAMLRPTRSYVLWKQMIGRGLRYVEGGTEHVIVCDHCANINRCGIGHPHNEPDYELSASLREIVFLGGKSGYKICSECGTINELGALECEQCGALFAGKGERKYLNIDGYLEEVPEGAITISALAEKIGYDEREIRYWLTHLGMPGRINQNLIDEHTVMEWFAINKDRIEKRISKRDIPDGYIPITTFARLISVSKTAIKRCIKGGLPNINGMLDPEISRNWIKDNRPYLLITDVVERRRQAALSSEAVLSALQKRNSDPAHHEHMRYLNLDPIIKEKRKVSMRNSDAVRSHLRHLHSDPEMKLKAKAALRNSEAAKAHLQRLNSDVVIKAKLGGLIKTALHNSEKHRAHLKRLHSDPEIKARRDEARRNSDKFNAHLQRLHSDPEIKARRDEARRNSDKFSTHIRRLNSDPGILAKRGAFAKSVHARRAAKQDKDGNV